jgi:hypothetical protein
VASVSNDWKNWVVLRGNDKTKEDDIQDIGKTIGITFEGKNHNKFSILSRSKVVGGGPILTPVEATRGGEDGGE